MRFVHFFQIFCLTFFVFDRPIVCCGYPGVIFKKKKNPILSSRFDREREHTYRQTRQIYFFNNLCIYFYFYNFTKILEQNMKDQQKSQIIPFLSLLCMLSFSLSDKSLQSAPLQISIRKYSTSPRSGQIKNVGGNHWALPMVPASILSPQGTS